MPLKSRILQVRKYLQLSQKEFGNSLGVSREVIANYENGRSSPPNSIIKLLCYVHNINPMWLKTGQGEMLDQLNKKSGPEILDNDDQDEYKNWLIPILAQLNPEDWELIRQIAVKLLQSELDQRQKSWP